MDLELMKKALRLEKGIFYRFGNTGDRKRVLLLCNKSYQLENYLLSFEYGNIKNIFLSKTNWYSFIAIKF